MIMRPRKSCSFRAPAQTTGRVEPFLTQCVNHYKRAHMHLTFPPRILKHAPEFPGTPVLWTLCWALLITGYWLGLLLTLPAAGFLVRLFMIQHDCTYGRVSYPCV